MDELAKAATIGLALNAGVDGKAGAPGPQPINANGSTDPVPICPDPKLKHYHAEEVCLNRPVRLNRGHVERNTIYKRLKDSGAGATLVPNQQTVTCPEEEMSLESPLAVKGLDTTWVVENTGTKAVVVSWVVDGIEWSPYEPGKRAIEDPKAVVPPGEWLNVPTFDSFVYHARTLEEDGTLGPVVLQHRVGLIPIGNPRAVTCDRNAPDVEPLDPTTAQRLPEFARKPTPATRSCNIIDVSFRNQAGCPLHIYWARGNEEIPDEGFNCGEKFRFHLGTKTATQDFFNDWESSTKFEGTFIGHTFVARLASNPNVVVDSYTVETSKVIDCPARKQKVATGGQKQAEAVVVANGMMTPDSEGGNLADALKAAASVVDVHAESF